MNDLSLALRSLEATTFEVLITTLLKSRYPSVDIQHVSGNSGDEGIDIISGHLDDKPTIWQCKSFQGAIGNSQKQQIRSSLNTALKQHNPRRWVLCVSTDLDVKTLRWWQNLVKTHAKRTKLQLWEGSEILRQLLYEDTIREKFFPNFTVNVPLIREALAGTNNLPIEDLAALTEQNAGAFLARLERMDSRFSYAVTHTRNQAPSAVSPTDYLLSVASQHSTIYLTPRDREALEKSPPEVNFSLRGTGAEKFLEHHRTGKPVKFSSDELTGVTSDFDFLVPGEWKEMTLEIEQSSQPTFPLRITFGKGPGASTYEYVLFRRTRAGTEEVEIESVTPLPFPITLLIRNGLGEVKFRDRCNGYSVEKARRMANALTTALKQGEIDFYDLSREERWFRCEVNGSLPDWFPQYCRFLDDACAVANEYGVDLSIPDNVTPSDHRSLVFLRKLHAGLSATAQPFSLTIDKLAHAPRDAVANIEIELERLAWLVSEFPEQIIVFGQRILTGPVQYEISRGRIRELKDYVEFLCSAPIGSTVTVTIEPIGEIRIQRYTQPEAVHSAFISTTEL